MFPGSLPSAFLPCYFILSFNIHSHSYKCCGNLLRDIFILLTYKLLNSSIHHCTSYVTCKNLFLSCIFHFGRRLHDQFSGSSQKYGDSFIHFPEHLYLSPYASMLIYCSHPILAIITIFAFSFLPQLSCPLEKISYFTCL